MGDLDEAIRDHLELKRRSGADPTEIERLEREALGPVRRVQESSDAPVEPGEPSFGYEPDPHDGGVSEHDAPAAEDLQLEEGEALLPGEPWVHETAVLEPDAPASEHYDEPAHEAHYQEEFVPEHEADAPSAPSP